MSDKSRFNRRTFLQTAGAATLGSAAFASPLQAESGSATGMNPDSRERMRIALVGTGVRGVGMYGRRLLDTHGDYVEMVGVCDSNPGRLDYAHDYIGADCPAYTDLDEMLAETNPERLVVTTWDWTHHDCIIAGMRHGCDIVVEKPITIDEEKAQAILDAQNQYGRDIIVTHNYRYAPGRARVKELIMEGTIGDVTTVDLHWNIDHAHLQRYMQRWHGESDKGGTLWVHKASHHFDLVNWWIDSDPVEVFANADLERFGPEGPFRGDKCRTCPHASECDYHWDITQSDHLMNMYVENENYDGYIRDNCVFREEIDAFDKHACVVRYANNAYLNYSLTGDTDHSGFWLAFNGTEGRIELREGGWPPVDYQRILVERRGARPRIIAVPPREGGHWGGDPLLLDKLFKDPDMADPLHQEASSRDGIMSVLAGVAARQSSRSGRPVQIADLTDLQPMAVRPRTR